MTKHKYQKNNKRQNSNNKTQFNLKFEFDALNLFCHLNFVI